MTLNMHIGTWILDFGRRHGVLICAIVLGIVVLAAAAKEGKS